MVVGQRPSSKTPTLLPHRSQNSDCFLSELSLFSHRPLKVKGHNKWVASFLPEATIFR
ncbi:MAG: hypothetical protein QOI57_2657 [Rubrobacteraceae bacterium]|jgi:hypothetical protein|nr:hypothetical protein [Rubrobacteraceae bacterium]